MWSDNFNITRFKVSYGPPTIHSIFRDDQSVQLSGTLVPTVSVQYIDRAYLNEPFTQCIETKSSTDSAGIYHVSNLLFLP